MSITTYYIIWGEVSIQQQVSVVKKAQNHHKTKEQDSHEFINSLQNMERNLNATRSFNCHHSSKQPQDKRAGHP